MCTTQTSQCAQKKLHNVHNTNLTTCTTQTSQCAQHTAHNVHNTNLTMCKTWTSQCAQHKPHNVQNMNVTMCATQTSQCAQLEPHNVHNANIMICMQLADKYVCNPREEHKGGCVTAGGGQYWDKHGRRWQVARKMDINSNFIIWTSHQISFRWTNEGKWGNG
jgi:hypothetical protein